MISRRGCWMVSSLIGITCPFSEVGNTIKAKWFTVQKVKKTLLSVLKSICVTEVEG